MAKVVVSYDGTANDRDALALGKLLARAGASLALAYVRHASEGDVTQAEALLAAGAAGLGGEVATHVVVSGSTPEGLRALALETRADLIVFGSEYRTARGHVDPQRSARRLLEGGPIALGIAPAGLAEADGVRPATIGAVGEDGDPCVLETAESLAARFGAEVAPAATAAVDLMVLGSKPGTVNGRVRISAAAEYLIELASCPILVLPRGVAVEF
jgi:nucleotide-binding universal stress UspA family protein